jgi:hypothetical protein
MVRGHRPGQAITLQPAEIDAVDLLAFSAKPAIASVSRCAL